MKDVQLVEADRRGLGKWSLLMIRAVTVGTLPAYISNHRLTDRCSSDNRVAYGTVFCLSRSRCIGGAAMQVSLFLAQLPAGSAQCSVKLQLSSAPSNQGFMSSSQKHRAQCG
jgi:hypothetical protein